MAYDFILDQDKEISLLNSFFSAKEFEKNILFYLRDVSVYKYINPKKEKFETNWNLESMGNLVIHEYKTNKIIKKKNINKDFTFFSPFILYSLNRSSIENNSIVLKNFSYKIIDQIIFIYYIEKNEYFALSFKYEEDFINLDNWLKKKFTIK